MKLIVKTILSGILGVSTLLPVAAIADNTGGTCSGSAGNVAPLEAQFRKDQAFTMTKDLLYKIVVALDNVLSTPADTAHDPDFFANIKFVTDLQETQDNMQIFIETIPPAGQITTAQGVINKWRFLQSIIGYRKRSIFDSIIVSYNDNAATCLRQITFHANGQSFATLKDSVALPSGFHTTRTFVDFDRFEATFVEVTPGVFRMRSVYQYTESSFPLPDGGLVNDGKGRSPLKSVDSTSPVILQLTAP